MFEIQEPEKEKIRVYGKEFLVRKPSVMQVKKFIADTKGFNESDFEVVDATISFLSGLGIDREILENLEISHMNLLIEHLAGVKKN